jgi:aminopeptidase-like protein
MLKSVEEVLGKNPGELMFSWARDLFPFNRSLSGQGVRDTLLYIQRVIPSLNIRSVSSGTRAFDWVVPNEWEITDAYLSDIDGNKIISFQENNLHVVGYSEPVDKIISKEELEKHLYSLPEQPTAIPYVTSYYKKTWGFCLSHNQRATLGLGPFHVVIVSKLFSGNLNYGELYIKGKSKKEVLLSTNICHPSLANNEISGPVILTALAKILSSTRNTEFSYRILFLPETIGSIYYISRNIRSLKKNVIAGWTLTCMGDDNEFSFVPSRSEHSLADKVSKLALSTQRNFKMYSWLDRGSDERQFCAPGVDLPVASIMRSKYGEYAEYHTSLDSLEFISREGLVGSLKMMQNVLSIVESNFVYKPKIKCEPQLSKRGLYPELSIKNNKLQVLDLKHQMNVLSYVDGKIDLIEITKKSKTHWEEVIQIVKNLEANNLIAKSSKNLNPLRSILVIISNSRIFKYLKSIPLLTKN